MISKSISVSDNTNKLSDFAALLFTWMIPHTDDYGIIEGTAGKVKALIVPRRKQTEKQVELAMQELQNNGLIWRYIYKDNEYLQFCKFDEHQEGLHKRIAPKNPIYSEVKDDSNNFREIPGNSPLIELKRTELKGKEEKVNYASHVTLSPTEYQKLWDKYGIDQTSWMIDKLNIWKGSNGKKTKSDYLTILKWVVKAYEEEEQKKPKQNLSIADKAKEATERYAIRHGIKSSNPNERDISLIKN
jgi:hypothetical protein